MKKRRKKNPQTEYVRTRRRERALAEIFNPFGPAPVSPAGLGLPEDSPALTLADSSGGETIKSKVFSKIKKQRLENIWQPSGEIDLLFIKGCAWRRATE